jgi:hypothetical protein
MRVVKISVSDRPETLREILFDVAIQDVPTLYGVSPVGNAIWPDPIGMMTSGLSWRVKRRLFTEKVAGGCRLICRSPEIAAFLVGIWGDLVTDSKLGEYPVLLSTRHLEVTDLAQLEAP